MEHNYPRAREHILCGFGNYLQRLSGRSSLLLHQSSASSPPATKTLLGNLKRNCMRKLPLRNYRISESDWPLCLFWLTSLHHSLHYHHTPLNTITHYFNRHPLQTPDTSALALLSENDSLAFVNKLPVTANYCSQCCSLSITMWPLPFIRLLLFF